MTMLTVCAVYDSAIHAFGRPIYVPASGAAIRSFQDEVNRDDKDNQLHKHPDDFELYQLAIFDDETGAYTNDKKALVRAKDLQTPKAQS
ncbi:MAG: nonstructural protein [Microvirus sp.]|nr:MAG: nonstructural protein [Microvirus sp.]